MLAFSQLAFTAPASAQDFPAKPITLVVAFAAGGNNHLRARQIGVPLATLLGKPVIVDNKPGASGNIGHEMVARAPADGYTLGIGAMGPLAVNPYVWKKVNFNPLQDFTPIVLVEKAPLVLVTRADSRYADHGGTGLPPKRPFRTGWTSLHRRACRPRWCAS